MDPRPSKDASRQARTPSTQTTHSRISIHPTSLSIQSFFLKKKWRFRVECVFYFLLTLVLKWIKKTVATFNNHFFSRCLSSSDPESFLCRSFRDLELDFLGWLSLSLSLSFSSFSSESESSLLRLLLCFLLFDSLLSFLSASSDSDVSEE